MPIKTLVRLFAVLLFVNLAFTGTSSAQGSPVAVNEKFALHALQTIHAAEMTFSATAGAGNYGNLPSLLNDGLIDAVLGSGVKYGYTFSITTFPGSPKQFARFQVSAVPLRYGKTGKRSFYIDQSGVIHGADHGGEPATMNDPAISICYGESSVISSMRMLHSAEITYFSTAGAGSSYGTLAQLFDQLLVDPVLASGEKCGYVFSIETVVFPPPALFRARARPRQYPVTGIRSFYIDDTGVLRGADKNGGDANADDPPVEN